MEVKTSIVIDVCLIWAQRTLDLLQFFCWCESRKFKLCFTEASVETPLTVGLRCFRKRPPTHHKYVLTESTIFQTFNYFSSMAWIIVLMCSSIFKFVCIFVSFFMLKLNRLDKCQFELHWFILTNKSAYFHSMNTLNYHEWPIWKVKAFKYFVVVVSSLTFCYEGHNVTELHHSSKHVNEAVVIVLLIYKFFNS